MRVGAWNISADDSGQVWLEHNPSGDCCSIALAENCGETDEGLTIPGNVLAAALRLENGLGQ